jgi:predicted nucleotide-binding protein
MKMDDALSVARVIQDSASGMPVTKLTLAQLMDRSPSSSEFRELLLASRAYGFTNGGVNADQFELAPLGEAATGADEVAQAEARRKAVLNIEPFRAFLTAYNGKKVPSLAAFKEFLVASADVASERTEDCIEHLLADALAAGMLRNLKGSDYVEVGGSSGPDMRRREPTDRSEVDELEEVDATEVAQDIEPEHSVPPGGSEVTRPPKKVFIAHGKNRTPLDQLKKMLDQFKVKYAVAIDEPNRGRPISSKVAALMRDECSSAIFIFTADEGFQRQGEDGKEESVWRPSENVVYELGAASVLYDRRIVIFKESSVTFPSDFSDLGYIEFQSDQLEAKMGDLFAELVALDVLEVRAKT